ncbi:DUF3303 family protein [Methanococcoides burtonii]|uniref:Uncharacterized protein n=1 Tax=Methanococcoides burtonii (strain DSM 6242 / NBRC 107633 / OCM 468 / ACE-M) TaxID=259564 RepID=Q12TZ7_METBU|nr:DUF3303 family protein [Methanococcoides burtonii]ABE53079.1 Hypothetical protein Mbur_2215 [Methanococcoides burtonii DSM 6242]
MESISEWIDLSTSRYIVVVDIKDSEASVAAAFSWKDICQIDTFPIMETHKLMTIVSEYM